MKIACELAVTDNDGVFSFNTFIIKWEITNRITSDRFMATVSHSHQRARDILSNFTSSDTTSFHEICFHGVPNRLVTKKADNCRG